jgi:hypothetical protein
MGCQDQTNPPEIERGVLRPDGLTEFKGARATSWDEEASHVRGLELRFPKLENDQFSIEYRIFSDDSMAPTFVVSEIKLNALGSHTQIAFLAHRIDACGGTGCRYCIEFSVVGKLVR